MNYDITRLNNNIDKFVKVSETYSFSKEELEGTDLIKLNDVLVEGEISKNSLDNICLNIDVSGVMVLPCAITLKPVNYPFSVNINGELTELLENSGENSTNFQNTIDILPIIWENILMEIPYRVLSDEVKDSEIDIKGDGWSFTTKEEENLSPLSELIDLIDDSEVK
ncbi:MAG: DUF177 domain-containing protein [bacterium]|nr:DUF177 domain-containing protein [bacterium]